MRPWGLLLASWLVAGCRPAAPVHDPGVDLPPSAEIDLALQEMEAAGVPPTAEEITTFLAEAEPASSNDGRSARLVTGRAQLRLGSSVPGRTDQSGRLDLGWGPVSLAVRNRQYSDGTRVSGAGARVKTRSADLVAGRIGLHDGWGLLAAGPGRGSGLSADVGLAPRRFRSSRWVGVPDERTLEGAALRLTSGRWSLAGAGGRTVVARDHVTDTMAAVVLRYSGATAAVGIFGLKIGSEAAVSVGGDIRGFLLSGGAEVAVWRTHPGVRPRLAGLVNVGWQAGRRLRLEALAGWTDFEFGPRLAVRPPLFKSWDGSGVGLRGVFRSASGTFVRALYARSRSRQRKWRLQDDNHGLLDLQLSCRAGSGFVLAVRWRETTETSQGWSERFPWAPPTILTRQDKRVVSAALTREQPGFRYSILLRSLQTRAADQPRMRHLWSVTGWRRWSRCFRLRGTLAGAWGDNADLVAAIVPLNGLVLPRHWGQWRSEFLAGIEFAAGGWLLQAAVSVREAEERGFEGMPTAVWLDFQKRW